MASTALCSSPNLAILFCSPCRRCLTIPVIRVFPQSNFSTFFFSAFSTSPIIRPSEIITQRLKQAGTDGDKQVRVGTNPFTSAHSPYRPIPNVSCVPIFGSSELKIEKLLQLKRSNGEAARAATGLGSMMSTDRSYSTLQSAHGRNLRLSSFQATAQLRAAEEKCVRGE